MEEQSKPIKIYIRDFKEGEQILLPLLLTKKQLRDRRDGAAKYLAITLSDRTGRIEGRIWDNATHWNEAHAEGEIVVVRGQVKAFEGKLQLMVAALKPCKPGEFDPSDFLPTTEADRDSLYESILCNIRKMTNKPLRELLLAFFNDPEWSQLFKLAPGAVSVHHNYLGGLLEHTHSVMSLCETAYLLYPGIDLDLLLAGAILHDIGKIEKYRYDSIIDMSDKGQFMGHIALGTLMISERLAGAGIEMPEDLRMKLFHLILSHHGTLEWGSPVEPKTVEALILHFADNMDAKVNQFNQVLKTNFTPGRRWTNYDVKLGRCLFTGDLNLMPQEADTGDAE